MLISAILGLIDVKTGVLYYINAEHPWAVLYRDKKAEFIENQLFLRKIGISGLEGSLKIKLFQLHPRDILIIGSDGRDDILLGSTDAGVRIINEDENQFLKRVTEGDGNLEKIEEAILKTGELTDDFSLIRIGFMEDKPVFEKQFDDPEFQKYTEMAREFMGTGKTNEAIENLEKALDISNDNLDVLRDLTNLYIKIKNFDNAIKMCEKYIGLNPADTHFLYLCSYTLKRKRDYERAIDYGERCKLRVPKHFKNLLNLADSYRLTGNLPRAMELLDSAVEIEPDNKQGEKLRELINKSLAKGT
jgi:tetratricopeptide (TPR) repeat protein